MNSETPNSRSSKTKNTPSCDTLSKIATPSWTPNESDMKITSINGKNVKQESKKSASKSLWRNGSITLSFLVRQKQSRQSRVIKVPSPKLNQMELGSRFGICPWSCRQWYQVWVTKIHEEEGCYDVKFGNGDEWQV